MNKNIVYIAIFLALTLLLFGSFIFSNKVLFGTDFSDLGHFAAKFYRDYVQDFGAFPKWQPHLHGGMPFVEAMHGPIFFPPSLLFRLTMPAHRSFGLSEVLFIFFAGWFMFILLRHYSLRRESAFLGGLAYMLSPILISLIYAGHDGKIWVTSILPLAVWLLERALAKRRFSDFILFGLGYALMILTAHPQMSFFASWLLGGLFVFRLTRGFVKKEITVAKGASTVGLFVLAILLGVGICFVQLYPPYDYVAKYSHRTVHTEEKGIEYGNSWRMNMEDLVSTVYPDFVGLDLQGRQTYWGRNVFRINSMYIGILIFALAIAGIIALKKPILYFFGGAAVFATTYAIGTQLPFFYLYYYLIPGVKNFRAPEMIFYLAVFSLCIAMAFAVDAILKAEPRDTSKTKQTKKHKRDIGDWIIWVAIGLTAGLLILSAFGKPLSKWWLETAPNFQNVNIPGKTAAIERNFPLFIKSAWLAIVMMWAGIGILRMKLRSAKISPMLVTAILAILILIDLWRIDKPFIVTVEKDQLFPRNSLVDYLLREQSANGPFRTFLLPNTMTYTHLAGFGLDAVSFSELHGNQLVWYDQFTGRTQRPMNIQQFPHFWDILNAEYLMIPQRISQPGLKIVANTGNLFLYQNLNAFPRARSFEMWQVVDHENALNMLRTESFISNPDFNYRNVLLVEEDPGLTLHHFTDSLIPQGYSVGKITDNKFDDFRVQIDMPSDGLLFLSQNWYPAWHAESGGEELKVIRANYSFIAVPLKAGSHDVHFFYDSPKLSKSFVVSFATLGLSIILLVVGLIFNKKSRGE
jgi:hypothetical protein